MKVMGRSLLAGIAALAIVAAGVVVLPGSAGSAPQNACDLAGARTGGFTRGNALTVQNNTVGAFALRVDRLEWQTVVAGRPCNYATAQARVDGSLCWNTPLGPRIQQCTPSLNLVLDNPIVGFPTVTLGTLLVDSQFSEGQSRTVTTIVGFERLTFTITRGDDTPVSGHYKKHWTLVVSPG